MNRNIFTNAFSSKYTLSTIFIAFVGISSSRAAVVFHSTSLFFEGTAFSLDLDGDASADVEIDTLPISNTTSDPYFLAMPLGSSWIAASGDMTTSFSAGDLVSLASLSFVGSPDSLKTGGAYYDAFGNAIEGWGGYMTMDDLGNPIFAEGKPNHQIDLFLVQLNNGVAWVDLGGVITGLSGNTMNIRWGYMEGAHETFAIPEFGGSATVPEPSSLVILGVGSLGLLLARRRNPGK